MIKLLIVFGMLIFTNCAPKADVDAYVKEICECMDDINTEYIDNANADINEENMGYTDIRAEIFNCADFSNNQVVYQELITQYMDENPDAGYLNAEENAPKVIESKLMESCPTYKKLIDLN